MKILNKMQRRVAIWILGTFKTSLSEGIEAIAEIIPIRFHLQKLARRSQMRPFKLLINHILRNLIDNSLPLSISPNPHSISSLTNCQKTVSKGHLIDSCTKSYGISPSFSPLNQEFSPGSCIIDIFLDRFSFNLATKKDKEKNDKTHAQELDNIVLHNSSSPFTALIITDASIKNDIATSISHVHIANQPLTKTVHHTAFVTSMEVELFAIRCGINQACSNKAISKIIVITDSIHAAKKFLTAVLTPSNVTLQQFLVSCGASSSQTPTTPLNFGSIRATLSGDSTMMLTRTPSHSNQSPSSLAKFPGIFARSLIATISSSSGR